MTIRYTGPGFVARRRADRDTSATVRAVSP
jgi:hypothetical protein